MAATRWKINPKLRLNNKFQHDRDWDSFLDFRAAEMGVWYKQEYHVSGGERTLAYQDYFLKKFKIMFKSNRVHLSHVENNGLEQNSTCSSLNVYPGRDWPGKPCLAWVVINSVLGSQCVVQAHFFQSGRRGDRRQQSGQFLFGREMAEDRAAAGEQQQGAEGLAGLGGRQDWGEARGEEKHLGSPVRGAPGDTQGKEEEKQDGEESWHCPPSVRARLLSINESVTGEFSYYFQNSHGGEGEMQRFHPETDENHNNAR